MKNFVSGVLVVMIIGFPLASWYYLDSGLTYRINLREALAPKGNVLNDLKELDIKGKTTWITRLDQSSTSSLKKFIPLVHAQFNDAPSYQSLILRDTTISSASMTSAIMDNKISIIDIDGRYANILADNWHSALIDTSGDLRYIYGIEKPDFDTLVEHIAMILPRLQKKDIAQKKHGAQ